MKTVAAISFRDNHSLSMDVEAVTSIEMGAPLQLEDGSWFCEMILRSGNGTIALQLLADSPQKFKVQEAEPPPSDALADGGME